MSRGNSRAFRSESDDRTISEESDVDDSFGSDSEDGWVKQKKPKAPTKRKPAVVQKPQRKAVATKKKVVTKKRKIVRPKKKAPKKPQSAYALYRTATSAALKHSNPTWAYADITKKASEMWKDLSESEKEPFKVAAEDDKERYEKELATYTPSDDEDDDEVEEEDDEDSLIQEDDYDDDFEDGSDDYEGGGFRRSSGREAPKKKSKKEKKAGPKRPSNAYLIYVNAKRPEVVRQNPSWPVTEVVKHLSALWKNMTEHDKKPYNNLAAVDKARYVKELSEYNL